MTTQELVDQLRAQADFIDADTYDECWEVKETPRGKMLRSAASRLSEMDAENKRLRDKFTLLMNRPEIIGASISGLRDFARAALEHDKGEPK